MSLNSAANSASKLEEVESAVAALKAAGRDTSDLEESIEAARQIQADGATMTPR